LGLLICLASRASYAQWDPNDAALSSCEQALRYRISREGGGRQPDVWIDQRRAQVRKVSNN